MSPAYRPAEERFWEKVEEGPDGCWLWTAGKFVTGGYGVFNLPRDGGAARAHRWAYEQMIGEIPAGLVLDHLCRTPACVNPYHLDPVTDLVNVRRGRKYLGDRCSQGHDMAEAHIFQDKRGFTKRVCRICRASKARAKYQRKKLEAVK
jgi:hypothetical protein